MREKMRMGKRVQFLIIILAGIFLASCQVEDISAIKSDISQMQASIANINNKLEVLSIKAVPTETEQPPIFGKVIVNNAAVRSAGNNAGEILEKLFVGEAVKILGIDEKREWVLIQTAIGTRGWINTQQILANFDLKTLSK
jgi:uncharacterized protein YgiM (DUF1202 family)